MTALTTKIADSQTRSAPRASATKLGSPGVSSRLTLRSDHSKELSAVEIDICAGLLVGVGVGDRVAVNDGTQPARDPGLEQKRLKQRGLPCPAMTDEGDVANPIRS